MLRRLIHGAARRARGALRRLRHGDVTDHEVVDLARWIDPSEAAWADRSVAEAQEQAFAALLADARAGRPRVDLAGLACAARATGLVRPRILEVGCGSGYLREVLLDALPGARYVGLDRSAAALSVGRERGRAGLVQGDNHALPFAAGAFELVVDGGALLHVRDPACALGELARVASRAVILHTVPVCDGRPTAVVRKLAYGRPVTERIFEGRELHALLARAGLRWRQTHPSHPYDLRRILGVPSRTETLLCTLLCEVRDGD